MPEFTPAVDFESTAGVETSGNAHATAGLFLAVQARGRALQGLHESPGIPAEDQTMARALRKALFTARITGSRRVGPHPTVNRNFDGFPDCRHRPP
jgi:hypothetical protein